MQRFIAIFFLLACALAHAGTPLNVVTCEPEWAALTRELAGDKVKLFSATTAQQDPHRIEARPALIAKVRGADLLICTGLELESGWLPILLQHSSNPRIQAGRPGHFEAGRFVPRLEVHTAVSRSEGDVHGEGNPHIQQDPRNIQRIADVLSKRLAQLDPENTVFYEARHRDFSARWQAAIKRWQAKAAPLKGVAVVSHHKDMVYLFAWLGMKELAQLEPKPGVEPSASYLAQLLVKLRQSPAKMVVRTPYQSARPSQWLSKQAGITAVELPFTVGGAAGAEDLFGLFDVTLDRLLGAAQ